MFWDRDVLAVGVLPLKCYESVAECKKLQTGFRQDVGNSDGHVVAADKFLKVRVRNDSRRNNGGSIVESHVFVLLRQFARSQSEARVMHEIPRSHKSDWLVTLTSVLCDCDCVKPRRLAVDGILEGIGCIKDGLLRDP